MVSSSSNATSVVVQPNNNNNNNNNLTTGTTTITVNPTVNRRNNDNRRSNKPIMEKRRRARINNCLNDLKALILEAMKKDPARHSKLEKADILEMTVKHLQHLQRQQAAMSLAADPTLNSKFRSGFQECAAEVNKFPGIESGVKKRLIIHLSNCLNQSPKQQEVQQVQVHILPNTPASSPSPTSNGSIIFNNGSTTTGVQLVPARLPNGEIALVLPSMTSQSVSNMPILLPIPQRSTSTASSATSSSYSGSPSHSPEPMDISYNQPKPLSLVIRKPDPPADNTPWRPW